ncbi:hypothetical protein IAU60_003372 [Kwoniella sp. DSM 27419]
MDEDEVADILGEASANYAPSRSAVPRRGENREFDRFFETSTAAYDRDEVDLNELRRAAWATWKIKPPTSLGQPRAETDEDDELARAIALSTQEHASSSDPRRRVIAVDQDDEDDELQRAIAMSEQEARAPKRQRRASTPEEERRMLAEAMAASLAESARPPPSGPAARTKPPLVIQDDTHKRSASVMRVEPASASTSSAPSLDSAPAAVLKVGGQIVDRAQLERERRERQAARQAAAGVGVAGPSTALSNHDRSGPARISGMTSVAKNSKPIHSESSSLAKPSSSVSFISSSSIHPLQSPVPFPSDAAGEYYPNGELRHTALVIGEPTTERTFSPKDVAGKHSQISLVIVSSFVLDDQWLMEQNILPLPEDVPTITVRPHPKDKPEYNGKIQLQPNGEMWVYPRMTNGFGSAHMKYFWIFYKTGRLRVIISTANLVPYDWEWIENTIFVQDFLPLPSPEPLRNAHSPHDFPRQFAHLFTHTRVHTALRHLIHNHPAGSSIPFKPDDAFADMARYDWSRVSVRLVLSIPGTYTGHDEVSKFGIARLGIVLNEEGWVHKAGEKLDAEFQGSSLGSYSLEWIDKFHSFISGKTSQQLVNRPKPSSWPAMRILFPSLSTVQASQLGPAGGGTMFCGKAFNAVTRPLFHDANSKRGGVLMHAKMLVALFEPQENRLGVEKQSISSKTGKRKAEELEDKNVGGWVYVGSHNFSPSAWGNVDVKKSPPTLNIKNYEIGIVFPLERSHARAAAGRIAPYKRPAKKYSAGDVPWDQHAHRDPA